MNADSNAHSFITTQDKCGFEPPNGPHPYPGLYNNKKTAKGRSVSNQRARLLLCAVFLKEYEILDELDKLREVKMIDWVILLQSYGRMAPRMQHFRYVRRNGIKIQRIFKTRQAKAGGLRVGQVHPQLTPYELVHLMPHSLHRA